MKHSKVVLTIFSIFTILMVLCSFGCPQDIPYEEPEDIETAPENGGWNIKEHATYKMKVGESIVVYSEGLSYADYRLFDENGEIYRGTALEWSADESSDAKYLRVLSAKKAGTAILKIEVSIEKEETKKSKTAEESDDLETVTYECVITVVDSNNSIIEKPVEELLVGIWKNNKSSIIFNDDSSGRIVIYKLDEIVLNTNFNYVVYSNINENDEEVEILSIRNANDELYNVDYTIQIESNKDSELQLKIYGNLPGLPSPSTWTKK